MRAWQVAWLLATAAACQASHPAKTCEASSLKLLHWPMCSPNHPAEPSHSDLAASLSNEQSFSSATAPAESVESSRGEVDRQGPDASEGSSSPAWPRQTHFPSFHEWKDRHDSHQSLRERLARASISKGTEDSTDPAELSNLGEETSVDTQDASKGHHPPEAPEPSSNIDRPISYVHPLPFSGTGQPEDPLIPLSSRTNYASFDCSAAVLQTSKQSKGASSILNNSKDKYMLTPCDAPENYVIIELCEEINVDALVLANWEFFSSMFKHFHISGSEAYPGRPEDWMSLGHFRAGNVRAPQVCYLLTSPKSKSNTQLSYRNPYP